MYSKPPFPFNGNKRNWIKPLQQQFRDIRFNEDVIIVDLFGGSGILSHLFANLYPNNKIIYNDYDHYLDLFNWKNELNEMIVWSNNFFNEKHYKKHQKISEEDTKTIKAKFVELFGENYMENKKLLNVLTSNFCFRSHDNLENMYFNVRKTPFLTEAQTIDTYILPNIEVVHEDYKDLINSLKDKPCFYILDPPYLMTSKAHYENEKFWGLDNTIDIFELCLKNKCILFESDRSGILSMIEMIKRFSPISFNYIASEAKRLEGAASDFYLIFNL